MNNLIQIPPTLSKKEALEAIQELKYFQDQVKNTAWNYMLSETKSTMKNSNEYWLLNSKLHVY